MISSNRCRNAVGQCSAVPVAKRNPQVIQNDLQLMLVITSFFCIGFICKIRIASYYIYSCHGRCRAPGCFVFLCFLCFFCFCVMMGWGGVGCYRSCSCYADDVALIMGWGGMLTFMFMLRWWCCVDHGVGWDGNVHVHVPLMMLHWSWGGVGC